MGKIAMAALLCFLPTIFNIAENLRGYGEDSRIALDIMHSLLASRWQVFTKLRLPSSLPYVFSALKIASTLAFAGAIVAEFSGADKGIGFLMLAAVRQAEASMIFATVIAASIGGIILYGTIFLLERKLRKRYHWYW